MIEIPVHCGSSFEWDGFHGSCHASDLASPISSAARPFGLSSFFIRSHKTGRLVCFRLSYTQKTGDATWTYWRSDDGQFTVSIAND